MQEVLRKLEQVQEIDLQINVILAKKADFPKRLAEHNAAIKTHQAKHDEKKKIVDELDKNKRQQLGALELNDERAKRSQEKLEQIKTNQEFQALQKELESLKKNSTVIQENAGKIGDEADKHRKELDSIESLLKTATSARDATQNAIDQEMGGLDKELARLNGLRATAVEGIEKRILATYDKVRQGKGGMGIAPALGGSCRGCNMRIPPQTYNELQRGSEIFTCPSCRRILVFKDAVRTVVASGSAS